MLLTVHVFVGAAAGIASQQPAVGFLAGVVSHHIMDMVPHWDPASWHFPKKDFTLTRRDYSVAAADLIVAFLAAIWLIWFIDLPRLQLLAFWGLVGGVLPDLVHHIPLWKAVTRRYTAVWFRFHSLFHATINPRYAWFGVVTQLVALGLAWWVIGGALSAHAVIKGSLPAY